MTPEQLDEFVAGLDEVKGFLAGIEPDTPVPLNFVNEAWCHVTHMREVVAEAAHRAAFDRLAGEAS